MLFSSSTDITETAVWRTRCGEFEQWQKDQVGCSQILQEGKNGGLDQGGISRDGAKWIDTSYVLEEDALKTCILYTIFIKFCFVILTIMLICILLL